MKLLGLSSSKKVEITQTEKITPELVEVFVSFGGTIVHAVLKYQNVQRGVFGSSRLAQQPIVINFEGETNLKGGSFSNSETIARFIRSQVLHIRGEQFKELRPEQETFPTLNFTLRLLVDDGNHMGALMAAGLTALYLHLHTLPPEQEPHDYPIYFPLTILFVEQCSTNTNPSFPRGSKLAGGGSARCKSLPLLAQARLEELLPRQDRRSSFRPGLYRHSQGTVQQAY